jgi:predicted nucleic acid-binding protein
LIIFDASAVVGAALKADSVPERALLRAEATDGFALSLSVDAEFAEVLGRLTRIPQVVRTNLSTPRSTVSPA